MEHFIEIGKQLKAKINPNEVKRISNQITNYTDNQLREKIIELCLVHEIDCQVIINLPHENCKKELLVVLMASV